MSLIPKFNLKREIKRIDDFKKQKLKQQVDILSYVGETFASEAKILGNYQDQTKNLRGSIGYAVVFNGKLLQGGIQGTSAGIAKGRDLIQQLAQKYKDLLKLVGVAGMEYAAAVESKKYDVISGSIPQAVELLNYLKKELGVS